MFDKSYVTKDVEQIDVNSEYFPDLVYAGLESHGSDLCGFVLKPQGKGHIQQLYYCMDFQVMMTR